MMPVGLKNEGNSCFVNAVLQALTSCDPLWNEVADSLHRDRCPIYAAQVAALTSSAAPAETAVVDSQKGHDSSTSSAQNDARMMTKTDDEEIDDNGIAVQEQPMIEPITGCILCALEEHIIASHNLMNQQLQADIETQERNHHSSINGSTTLHRNMLRNDQYGHLNTFDAWRWGSRLISSMGVGRWNGFENDYNPLHHQYNNSLTWKTATPAMSAAEIVELLPSISYGALQQGRQEDAHEFLRALLGAAQARIQLTMSSSSSSSSSPSLRGTNNTTNGHNSNNGNKGEKVTIDLVNSGSDEDIKNKGSEGGVHREHGASPSRAAAGLSRMTRTGPFTTHMTDHHDQSRGHNQEDDVTLCLPSTTSTFSSPSSTSSSSFPSSSFSSSSLSYLRGLFHGSAINYTQCQECAHTSTKIDPIEDLQLDITRAGTVQSALSEYCKIEILTAENAYDCSVCHKKTNAARCMKIQCVPRVLPIQLKRFGYTFEIDDNQQNSSASSSSSSSASSSSSSSASSSSLSVAAETMVDLYRRSPFSSHTNPHETREMRADNQVHEDNGRMDVVDMDNGGNRGSGSGSSSSSSSSIIIFLDQNEETTTNKHNHSNSNNSSSSGVGGNREIVTMKPYKLSHLVEYPKVLDLSPYLTTPQESAPTASDNQQQHHHNNQNHHNNNRRGVEGGNAIEHDISSSSSAGKKRKAPTARGPGLAPTSSPCPWSPATRLVDSTSDCKLSLFAVVVHKGSSLSNGHYIAYVKTPPPPPASPSAMATANRHIHSHAPTATNSSATTVGGGGGGGGGISWRAGENERDNAREGVWYRIDDEEVVAVTEGEALSQRDAYILFYQQPTPSSPYQKPPHYQQQQPQQPQPQQQPQQPQPQQALVHGPCHVHNHGLALGLKIPLRATVKTDAAAAAAAAAVAAVAAAGAVANRDMPKNGDNAGGSSSGVNMSIGTDDAVDGRGGDTDSRRNRRARVGEFEEVQSNDDRQSNERQSNDDRQSNDERQSNHDRQSNDDRSGMWTNPPSGVIVMSTEDYRNRIKSRNTSNDSNDDHSSSSNNHHHHHVSNGAGGGGGGEEEGDNDEASVHQSKRPRLQRDERRVGPFASIPTKQQDHHNLSNNNGNHFGSSSSGGDNGSHSGHEAEQVGSGLGLGMGLGLGRGLGRFVQRCAERVRDGLVHGKEGLVQGIVQAVESDQAKAAVTILTNILFEPTDLSITSR